MGEAEGRLQSPPMEGWGPIRKALIVVSRTWQYETYGPLIGPRSVQQERNTYEGVRP